MQHFTSLWSALAAVHFLPEWIQKKSFTLEVMNAIWHLLVCILLAFTLSLTNPFYFFLDLLVIFHWTNYFACFWTGSQSQSSNRDSNFVLPRSDEFTREKKNASNDVSVTREGGFRFEQQVLLGKKSCLLWNRLTFIALQFIHLPSYFPFGCTPRSIRMHFLLMFFLLGSTDGN